MAVPDPNHLCDQADRLIIPPSTGSPRQIDLRRGISNAYYALFHFTLAAFADQVIGRTKRTDPHYSLAYRSVDHARLKALCQEVVKSTISPRYKPYVPADGFDDNIVAFATAMIELQEERHSADYDPLPRFNTSDALIAIANARGAMRRFSRARPQHRQVFLTLLMCSPR